MSDVNFTPSSTAPGSLAAGTDGTVVPAESLSTKEIVVLSTSLLKVAETLVFFDTPMAPDAGDTTVTVGGALGFSVVNDQEKGAVMTLPDKSVAPLTVAV